MNPGIGLLAVAAGLVGLAAIDRGLSALWPASYGLYHPLAAIAMLASLPLVVYLITRR
ncbi:MULTISPECIES: hypothetical protein [Burkholderia]|uniref:hypothetical protein n=1 Tax=Burkholderia TaxID=32008 RepID=UPI001589FB9B|nr:MULTISPECIES: hypothetical protein [Burkholderia]MBR7944629.1 hypothetical protein [Burkholderia cenocepacia]CAG2382928.1 hypothetical protein BCCR12632_07206 [Burkholderia cenocepacia]CAG2382934.1 hypothetical protein BCCR75389_07163 [Burkholderia cenocepacia]CAG2382944.1 hypothetical protein BCCR75388_07171 [Burkholderia cenocepacia]CAG2382972.1 hypothetical protein BCCR75384_07197 [Burkholderia cenocepacia]